MSSYNKPTKLVSLNFYSPFQTFSENRRLISRDKTRIFGKFSGTQDLRELSQPLMNTCVRSFMWMYRSPHSRMTSFHQEQGLGKERKVKLAPIAKVPAPVTSKQSKNVITRKPTISLKKQNTIENITGVLSEQTAKGLITFTSAVVETAENSVKVPLNALKDLIFTSEGEVCYNISQCFDEGKWNIGTGLYSNFDEIPQDYAYFYYLPNMQTSIFILKQKALFARKLGKIISILEQKGLTMKINRFLQYEEVGILMAWEGCEAHIVIQNIASVLGPELFEFIDESSEFLTSDDKALLTYSIVPTITCKVNEKWVKLKYPTVTYSLANTVLPVPIGLLKSFILEEFQNWGDLWIKNHEKQFPHRRAGLETSTLKSNISLKDEPCVITLNCYELQISNQELEASFAFKIKDLQYIFQNSGPDLVKNLMNLAKLEENLVKNRKVWDLTIEVSDLAKSASGEISKISKIHIGSQEFMCKFTTPWVELYKPHSEETVIHELTLSDISKVLEANFENWEGLFLKYFN